MKYRKYIIIYLIVMCIASLFIGALDINVFDLFNNTELLETFLISRIPRLITIILTAAALSISGLIMQKLTMNNFVSPSTGATISSAQLGILISLILIPNSGLMFKSILSFIFSILGTMIFVSFIHSMNFKNKAMVPLVGIMFSYILSGITTYLAYTSELTQTMNTWLVGSFSLIIKGRYEIIYITLPLLIIAYIYANYFNIVGMGSDISNNLGIPYKAIMALGLVLASVLTASTVVIVGSISYIGLIIPNIVTIVKGDRIKDTLWDNIVLSSSYLLTCDIIARLINYPYEMPVELISGLLGSIIFIFILFRSIGKNPLNIIQRFINKKGDTSEIKL